jgi:hypothetical protein
MSRSKVNGNPTDEFDSNMMSYVKYGFKNYGDSAAKRKDPERLPTNSLQKASSQRLKTYGGKDTPKGSVGLDGQLSFQTARLRLNTEPDSNVFRHEDGNQGSHSIHLANFNQTVTSKVGHKPINFKTNPARETSYIGAVKSFLPSQQLHFASQSGRIPCQVLQ